MTEKRRIFFDTETTGVGVAEGHRIIEIGCIETVGLQKTGNNFQVFLNPEREIDLGATKVHGKTYEMLKDKPKFIEVAKDFLNFIADGELIAHNATFDMSFINHELSLIGMSSLQNEVTDSLMIARRRFPGQPASLDALCKRFNIDNSFRTLHGALLDADLLADVFVKMCNGDFNYKVQTKIDSEVKRKTSFPIRNFKISEEDLQKHKEFLKELGF